MKLPSQIDSEALQTLISMALKEDIGSGDVTTAALIRPEARGQAFFLAKQSLVICGLDVAAAVFKAVDPSVTVSFSVSDGEPLAAGTRFGNIEGPLAALLTAERTALNFLQHLSGIATKTAAVTALLAGSKTRLLDTRKTTPGWRSLEKYAVRIGGGVNHRIGLFDAFLIKNNHLDTAGLGLIAAVEECRRVSGERALLIEVEVRDQVELAAAISARADRILLDNMTPAEVRSAVDFVRSSSHPAAELEASGGITEANAAAYAQSGVDFISLGAVTHSATAVDISLRISRKDAR